MKSFKNETFSQFWSYSQVFYWETVFPAGESPPSRSQRPRWQTCYGQGGRCDDNLMVLRNSEIRKPEPISGAQKLAREDNFCRHYYCYTVWLSDLYKKLSQLWLRKMWGTMTSTIKTNGKIDFEVKGRNSQPQPLFKYRLKGINCN